MRVRLIGAALALVCLVVLGLTVRLRGWGDFNLVALAQGEMRRELAGRAVVFLEKPDAQTTVHAAGRADLRVVCGWLAADGAGWAPGQPRFFYVLYQMRLAWVSRETVFLQAQPDEASPDWGETWCRNKAVS